MHQKFLVRRVNTVPMLHASTTVPGYTATEKQVLESMFDELHSFIETVDWHNHLPIVINRAYTMERLGNMVQLSLKLYKHVSKVRNQTECKLLLDINIQGTGNEKWVNADAGFFLTRGSVEQVAADIRAFRADVRPIQAKLAEEYRGTFYNS